MLRSEDEILQLRQQLSELEHQISAAQQHGMELKTTHPDEVAEAAVAGILADTFWICPRTEESLAKFLARVESIRTLQNPVAASVG